MPRRAGDTVHAEIDATRSLIGRGPAMHRLWGQIQRVASTDLTVLITGPTGTGKELVARLIHKQSPRANQEFLAVDCSAVAPTLLESELFGHERGAFTGAERERVGVFELAHGTTLFLDEIGNIPLDGQAKLLRVLQEREFRRLGGRRLIRTDFRLVTATNADLTTAVRAGTFRSDLYHRLTVVQIDLPPLKDRRENIPLLASHFINQKRLRLKRPGVCRLSHEALDLLMSHDWPGNVRELENVIEIAILECPGDTIEASHVVFSGGALRQWIAPEALGLHYREARRRALASFQCQYLLAQLRRYQGSIKLTARHAGVSPKHIRTLMKRHGISRRDFRPPLRLRRPSPGQASVPSDARLDGDGQDRDTGVPETSPDGALRLGGDGEGREETG